MLRRTTQVVGLTAALALTSSVLSAGVITGQFKDNQGNPVKHAIFQVESMDDGDIIPLVNGGFTDANGNFTTTITPNGDYRLTVFPQAPPLSSLVTGRFEDITVGSTPSNLGVLQLEIGANLSGRVVNSMGGPLQEVQLEFLNPPDFQALDMSGGSTNVQGYFSVTVPFGQCEVHFEPGPVPYYGSGQAPITKFFNVTGPIALGDVVMPPGFIISGVARRQSDNSPVVDAEIEIVKSATGESVWSHKNKTSETGSFAVVVAAGTYDFAVVPDPDDLLAAKVVTNRTVPPGGSLGTLLLTDGVEMKGKVKDPANTGHAGVSISVVNSATQQNVFIPNANTTAGGSYKTVVPVGTLDVTFDAPFSLPLGTAKVTGVVANQDFELDATVPSVPFYSTVGSGAAGLGGVTPQISATGGTPRLGNSAYTVQCTQAAGGAKAIVFASIGSTSGLGGTFSGTRLLGSHALVNFVQLSGTLGEVGTGSGSFALPVAENPLLVGSLIRARFLILDAAAPGGRSMTQELNATVCL